MWTVLALLTVALAPPASGSAASRTGATIIVNEFAVAGSESDADSFFELRNVSGSAIDLSGWSIFRCDERGLRENVRASRGRSDGSDPRRRRRSSSRRT